MVAFVASVTSKAIQLGERVDMITPQPKINVKMNTRHLPVPCLRSQHAMVVVIDQYILLFMGSPYAQERADY